MQILHAEAQKLVDSKLNRVETFVHEKWKFRHELGEIFKSGLNKYFPITHSL